MSLLSLLLFALELAAVLSCTCLPNHYQEMLCSRQILIKAKAVSKGVLIPDPHGEDYYELEVEKKFMGSLCKNFNATTATDSARCGAVLTLGKSYLLRVFYSGPEYRINSCETYSWDDVPYAVRKSLIFNYRRNCKCEVPAFKPPILTDEMCDKSTDPFCLNQNSWCERVNGKCEWQNADMCTTF